VSRPPSSVRDQLPASSLQGEPLDENLWLEEIDSKLAREWVEARNDETLKCLKASPDFEPLFDRLLSIYQSRDRIAVATVRGPWLYNFWQDREHLRGIWRRTTLESYSSADPRWHVLLDLDQLAEAEHENWVWGGATMLYPEYRLALLTLSRGGGDAAVVREYDCEQRAFVADGFNLSEAKSEIAWIDQSQVFVATDLGPGSLTRSGYPRIVKRWRRNTALTVAQEESSGDVADVGILAHCSRDWHEGRLIEREWVIRNLTFHEKAYLVRGETGWQTLEIPNDARLESFADQLLVVLKSDWQIGAITWPQGAVIAIGFDAFLAGERGFELLFSPGPRKALSALCTTRGALLISYADDLEEHCQRLTRFAGKWVSHSIELDPSCSNHFHPFNADQNDDVWVFQSGPLLPTRIKLWRAGEGEALLTAPALKSLPGLFKSKGAVARRYNAVSQDGTLIPYVVVGKEGAGASTPTLLYGYGGFEIPMLPLTYTPSVGAAWIERGGNYVVAALRGGGEFGPGWHLGAVRDRKQRSYDDFIAVASDLIERKLASPSHLGIQGGSNGGLLVGAVMVQRPELFSAVLCQVPLLDMRRYHLLLAGASWVAEYGDPEAAADWSFIGEYSPYQKLSADAHYPPILISTSTRDDRVHPGHARKMTARMRAHGHDVLYFENTEGGHAGAANARQKALLDALAYTFLWQKLL
jgi:prolyl oligopeptidase